MSEKETTASEYLKEAIRLSIENVDEQTGGPFGAVIVKNGAIIARGTNRVTATNDPTAHAEITAIRAACKALNTFDLTGCELYSSCEPCPMCLSAIYWSRISVLYFAATKEDAAKADFDDAFIYTEIEKPFNQRTLFTRQMLRQEALQAFEKWNNSPEKIVY